MSDDPYYQQSIVSDLMVQFRPDDSPTPLVFRVHHNEERRFAGNGDIIPLRAEQTISHYLQIRVGLDVPDIVLTVPLYPAQERIDNEIGLVADATQVGMKFWELGDGQAWFYPNDQGEQIIVLWELLIHRDLGIQTTMMDVWRAFERVLWQTYPSATAMVITRTDPDMDMAQVRDALGFAEPPASMHIRIGVKRQAACYWKARPTDATANDGRQ